MRGIFFTDADDAAVGAYESLGHDVHGEVVARLVSPADFALWLVRAELPAGSAVGWRGDRGDEAVYVVGGEVEVDGRTCPAGGAAIVESGVTTEVRTSAGARIAHFGSRRAPESAGQEVHVIGPGGTWASVGDGRDTRYFADSECEGCDVTLFYTGRDHEYVSAPHSHSADELIHVLHGEVVVGRRRLGPGSTIAVAADRRYGFRSPRFGFLNYRPRMATLTRAGETIEEGGRVHGFDPVMDLR